MSLHHWLDDWIVHGIVWLCILWIKESIFTFLTWLWVLVSTCLLVGILGSDRNDELMIFSFRLVDPCDDTGLCVNWLAVVGEWDGRSFVDRADCVP